MQVIKLDMWTDKVFQWLKWVINPPLKVSWLNSSQLCVSTHTKSLLLRGALEKPALHILREALRNGHMKLTPYLWSFLEPVTEHHNSEGLTLSINELILHWKRSLSIYIQNLRWWKHPGMWGWRRGVSAAQSDRNSWTLNPRFCDMCHYFTY